MIRAGYAAAGESRYRRVLAGGKSGQQRAGGWLTARRCEPMESATENIPPMDLLLGGHRQG